MGDRVVSDRLHAVGTAGLDDPAEAVVVGDAERLADTITRRDQAEISQLQVWLSEYGLAPHGHSHQRVDRRRQTDLERLSRLRGVGLDMAFLDVLTARERAGITMATAEARQGARPEVRRLARRMLVEQQADIRQMNAWRQAWKRRQSFGPERD
jgi:uncharacterized protein (DUF305 family)